MSEQQHARRHAEEQVEDVEFTGRAQQQEDNFDSLLDEIDSVLETNAEEFVKGFVQKGGQ